MLIMTFIQIGLCNYSDNIGVCCVIFLFNMIEHDNLFKYLTVKGSERCPISLEFFFFVKMLYNLGGIAQMCENCGSHMSCPPCLVWTRYRNVGVLFSVVTLPLRQMISNISLRFVYVPFVSFPLTSQSIQDGRLNA